MKQLRSGVFVCFLYVLTYMLGVVAVAVGGGGGAGGGGGGGGAGAGGAGMYMCVCERVYVRMNKCVCVFA